MSDEFDEFFPPIDVSGGEPDSLPKVEESPAAPQAEEQEEQQQETTTSPRSDQFEDDIFKKWFRTRDRQGFLSVRGWFSAGKISVDIGEVTGDGPVNTQVWTDAIPFATYLRAITNGMAPTIYPATSKLPAESFEYYGGSNAGGNPVSRVFKVNYWQVGQGENRSYDERAFAFKAGHFKARQAESGAFIPDMSQPLSVNMIKVSRAEVAEMSYRLDLAITNFATRSSGDIFRALNGNNR